MNGILYISSHKTGHGHVSITTALTQQIKKMEPFVKINDIDAFSLGGPFTEFLSRIYNTVVVNAPFFWKISYEFGNIFPSILRFFTAISLRTKLLEQIERLRPRLIMVTHPAFVSAVLDVLESRNMDIPVAVMIADLDNVTRLWADSRAFCTFCPTDKAKNTMLGLGIPEEKLKVFGFPVRDAFNHSDGVDEVALVNSARSKSPTILLMNGSQGMGYVKKIAEILLQSISCDIIVLAGKNKALKASLEESLLPAFAERIKVLGFTENVDYYMSIADILILRASPNVLMEAVNLCKPVIVTGALTGQEEKNPQFVEDKGLGIICKDLEKLPQTVEELLADDGRRLKQIIQCQKAFRQLEAAENTARSMLEIMRNAGGPVLVGSKRQSVQGYV